MGLPAGFFRATNRQNDLRRMSNDWAVDLAVVGESSTRTVTSGDATRLAQTLTVPVPTCKNP
jgi:hypothetical protein